MTDSGSARALRIGVQLHTHHASFAEYRRAWLRADELGVDSIWTWDHLLPVSGDLNGQNLEGWTLLSALGAQTRQATVGPLVVCMAFRNPGLLALMAKTLDHVVEGRLILGVGAGWNEREFQEFGFEFGTAAERLQGLERGIEVLKERWARDAPPPTRGSIPILVGGGGERVTLRIAAQHADIWSGFGPVAEWRRKSEILDDWCLRLGRDPSTVQRGVSVNREDFPACDDFADAGATLLIYRWAAPFDVAPVQELLAWRDARRAAVPAAR